MGCVHAWLPKGRWTDIFTNQSYLGEDHVTLFRDLDTIPVLAKEGAIIPLSADSGNQTDNPVSLEIWAFSGNGNFTLIEDDLKTDCHAHKAITDFKMEYRNHILTFTIDRAKGDISVLPPQRNYKVIVKDLFVDGKPLVFEFNDADINEVHSQSAENALRLSKEPLKETVIRILSRWQKSTSKKAKAYEPFEGLTNEADIKQALIESRLPNIMIQAIKEYMV